MGSDLIRLYLIYISPMLSAVQVYILCHPIVLARKVHLVGWKSSCGGLWGATGPIWLAKPEEEPLREMPDSSDRPTQACAEEVTYPCL